MRKLKILGLLFILVLGGGYASLAQQIPDPMVPKRMVNDFTGLFNPQEQNALETKLQHYLDTTSTQIYVVTVNTLDGQDIAAYAALMGDRWKIGQKGKDNGILLLIKPKNDEGKGEVFITTGYGMEGVITDAMSRRIIEQQVIPAFKEGKYYEGIDKATSTIIALASGLYKGEKKSKSSGAIGAILFFGLLIVMLLLGRKGGGRTYSSRGSSLPFWMLMGASSFGNFSSGGGSFGGGSGGGFGGGFSGGGGGSFGGGGAGGSW
jgi:Beta-propeller domains of methanol dehydrogenase type